MVIIEEGQYHTDHSMELNRKSSTPLSVFGLIMINVIAIDSLRNIPTNAAAGLSIVSFYIIAGVFFLLPCILITSELATHYPKRGGVYIWVREAFGARCGFVAIWLQWIYNVVWYPSILLFIATNIAYLINPEWIHYKIYMVPMVIGMFLSASLVNAFGMKISGVLSTISAIIGTMLPMIILIALAVHWIAVGKPLALPHPSWHDYLPHLQHHNHLALLSIVLFSLMGIEMSAIHAAEVQQPEKGYPKALRISGAIILISLILATLAIALVVPQHTLNIVSGMDQALSLLLNQNGLHWLLPLTIVMIIIGSFGGMAAWVIGPTKALMVAAEDGGLPRILGRRNRHQAPTGMLVLQCIIVIALCSLFLFYQQINTVYWIFSDLTAILALIFYILFFAAAIQLRYKTPANKNAYRIPGKNHSGVWLAGTSGILTCSIVIVISFIPPANIPIGNIKIYEGILIIGSLLMTLIPLPLYHWSQRQHQRTTSESST